MLVGEEDVDGVCGWPRDQLEAVPLLEIARDDFPVAGRVGRVVDSYDGCS